MNANTQSDPEKKIQTGSALEANHIFPAENTSDLKSTYYRESYAYPYNPDPLCSGNTYDTYDEMRNDDQVKVCLSLKKDMVINTGWEIECEDDEVKDFFEENLREMYNPDSTDYSFEDSMRDVMSAYDYGFSNSEITWELIDGQYWLKAIKTRAPHTWQFDLDNKGNIKKLIQSGAAGPMPLDPKNFLHFVYQPEFCNPYGKSDLRAAHLSWKAKKFFQRMYCIYVERFATPTTVGRYKNGLDDAEIDRVQTMLESIQNNTTLTIPEDVAVEFIQSARDASEAYERGIHLWNLAISRAILVPDLMGVSGDKTSGGSFALGKTQFESFLSTIKRDRESLERKVNLRLILPLARANFGQDVDIKFKLKPWSNDDVAEYLKLWVDAVSKNIYKPGMEEIDHFRESIKFPTPEIEMPEAIVPPVIPGGQPGEPMKPGQPGQEMPISQVPKKEQPTPPGTPTKEAAGQEPKAKEGDYGLLIFRDLYSYEKKVDFAQVKRTLDVSERSLAAAMTDVTKKMRSDLLQQIRDKRILERFKPQAIEQIKPKFGKEMNASLKSDFRQLFKEAADEARREILPNGTKAYVQADLMPEEFSSILEAESFKIVGDYQTDITKRATNRIVKGLKDGLSEPEIVSLIKDDIETATERWLATLIRTKSTEIYNAARKTIWETDPTISQIVEAYGFSAILDERTSDVCRSLDGRIYDKGDFIDRITPPLHFNCRSILVPITRYEDYEASTPPSLESLVEKGGNLIAATNGD